MTTRPTTTNLSFSGLRPPVPSRSASTRRREWTLAPSTLATSPLIASIEVVSYMYSILSSDERVPALATFCTKFCLAPGEKLDPFDNPCGDLDEDDEASQGGFSQRPATPQGTMHVDGGIPEGDDGTSASPNRATETPVNTPIKEDMEAGESVGNTMAMLTRKVRGRHYVF